MTNKIWACSDTHFDHKNMIIYEGRPKNFNDLIIKRWNELVAPDDIVIHLGDFALANGDRIEELALMLNGRKIITFGNHDKNSPLYFMNRGFDFACQRFQLNYFGKKILFSHKPFVEKEIRHYDYNIHGHLHRNQHRIETLNNPVYQNNRKRYILVQAEDDFKPILLKKLVE